MKPRALILIGLVAVCAELVGCGNDEAAKNQNPTPTPPIAPRNNAAPPPATAPSTISMATTRPGIERSTAVIPTTSPSTDPSGSSPAKPATVAEPSDTKAAEFFGLTAPKPATWIWQPPSPTGMSVAEYAVPGQGGSNQAKIAVIPAGGTIDANIARWKGQFRTGPDGGPVEPKISTLEADSMDITLVEFAGEYAGMGGIFNPDHLFITAIVQAPNGQLFIRFVGPTATVEANREPYMEMIRGLKRVEPSK